MSNQTHRLKLKRQKGHDYTPYPTYGYYFGDKHFLNYSAPKNVTKSLFKRYQTGLARIPKDAKILFTKEDRIPYDQKFLGGFVCEKLGFTYGIYIASQDRILTCPNECLYWELTPEEIKRFTDYENIQEKDD